MTADDPGRRSESAPGAAALLSDVVAGIGRLVRGELALARAEAVEGARQAAGGLGRIAAAAVIGLVGLQALAGAAVTALIAAGIGPVWSPLLVGLALCVVAAVLFHLGRSALGPRSLLPRRSLRNLERDAAAVKDALTPEGGTHA